MAASLVALSRRPRLAVFLRALTLLTAPSVRGHLGPLAPSVVVSGRTIALDSSRCGTRVVATLALLSMRLAGAWTILLVLLLVKSVSGRHSLIAVSLVAAA